MCVNGRTSYDGMASFTRMILLSGLFWRYVLVFVVHVIIGFLVYSSEPSTKIFRVAQQVVESMVDVSEGCWQSQNSSPQIYFMCNYSTSKHMALFIGKSREAKMTCLHVRNQRSISDIWCCYHAASRFKNVIMTGFFFNALDIFGKWH